jgi:hypothetical protein
MYLSFYLGFLFLLSLISTTANSWVVLAFPRQNITWVEVDLTSIVGAHRRWWLESTKTGHSGLENRRFQLSLLLQKTVSASRGSACWCVGDSVYHRRIQGVGEKGVNTLTSPMLSSNLVFLKSSKKFKETFLFNSVVYAIFFKFTGLSPSLLYILSL